MEGLSLLRLAILLKKSLPLLVILGLFGMIAGGIIAAYVLEKKYESKAQFYVNVIESKELADNIYYSQIYARSVVNTYIQLLNTMEFYDRLIKALDMEYTQSELSRMIKFEIVNSTEIFEGRVVTSSPTLSLNIANALSKATLDTIGEFQDGVRLDLIQTPSLAEESFFPNIYLMMCIGLVISVLASGAVITLNYSFNDRIKTEDNLTSMYNIPVLSIIPGVNMGQRRKEFVSSYFRNNSLLYEPYRRAAAEIILFSGSRTNQLIAVIDPKFITNESAILKPDYTGTAVRLAYTLSQVCKRKVLYSGNKMVIEKTDAIDMLTANAILAESNSIILSGNKSEVIEKYRIKYEYIVLDIMRMKTTSDALFLTSICDGVILSIQEKSTRYEELFKTLSLLNRMNTNIIGFIIHRG